MLERFMLFIYFFFIYLFIMKDLLNEFSEKIDINLLVKPM